MKQAPGSLFAFVPFWWVAFRPGADPGFVEGGGRTLN